MRKLSLVALATLAVVVPSLAVAPAQARAPKAELIAKQVGGTIANGRVAVEATVKNKGNRKAGRTATVFRLSKDATASADDPVLGTVATGKVRPKRSKRVSGSFAVPASLASGSYRVIACVDAGQAVKERRDSNNCKAGPGSVTVAPTGPVTITAVAGAGGTVAASAVTGGACAQLVCTFPTNGTGTVTFTPTANAGFRFKDWTGCTGFTRAGDAITFARPTGNQTCTANFVQQVTISWELVPALAVAGSVAAVVSHGTCGSADPVTGAGSCVVDAGVGTVTLTASPGLFPFFGGWGGATCDGQKAGPVVTFSAPAVDKACTATFSLVPVP